jgi:chemotaxis protein MotB
VRVVEAMIETGFAPTQVIAAGMGEFAPVASNEDPAGREKNRRIEIILLPNLSDLPNLTDS